MTKQDCPLHPPRRIDLQRPLSAARDRSASFRRPALARGRAAGRRTRPSGCGRCRYELIVSTPLTRALPDHARPLRGTILPLAESCMVHCLAPGKRLASSCDVGRAPAALLAATSRHSTSAHLEGHLVARCRRARIRAALRSSRDTVFDGQGRATFRAWLYGAARDPDRRRRARHVLLPSHRGACSRIARSPPWSSEGDRRPRSRPCRLAPPENPC